MFPFSSSKTKRTNPSSNQQASPKPQPCRLDYSIIGVWSKYGKRLDTDKMHSSEERAATGWFSCEKRVHPCRRTSHSEPPPTAAKISAAMMQSLTRIPHENSLTSLQRYGFGESTI